MAGKNRVYLTRFLSCGIFVTTRAKVPELLYIATWQLITLAYELIFFIFRLHSKLNLKVICSLCYSYVNKWAKKYSDENSTKSYYTNSTEKYF